MRVVADDEYHTNINIDYYNIIMFQCEDTWNLVAKSINGNVDVLLAKHENKEVIDALRKSIERGVMYGNKIIFMHA